MTLEWVIVGGGLQGVHLAARLLDDGGVGLDQLAVVDPGERLLEQWRARVAVTGMRFLRSPSMHHLDSAPYSLQAFAAQQRGHRRAMFTTPMSASARIRGSLRISGPKTAAEPPAPHMAISPNQSAISSADMP